MQMDKITFQCETVTPLILGAATKGSVELRPPAIKAALRFWWRAMHAHLTLKELKEHETKIFGGVGENDESSKVVFIKFSSEVKIIKTSKLPHKGQANVNSIKENSQFFLEIGLIKNEYLNIEQLKSLFIISSYLGNLGNRSRRAFGVWKINKIKDNNISINFNELIQCINLFTDKYEYVNGVIDLKSKTLIKTPKFPFIRKIYKSEYSVTVINEFLINLMHLSSDTKSQNASKYGKIIGDQGERLASPVVVTLNFENQTLYPIVTELKNPIIENDDDDNQSYLNEYIIKILNIY